MRWRYIIVALISVAIFLFIWIFIPASYPRIELSGKSVESDLKSIRILPAIWLERLRNETSEFGIRDTLCRLDQEDLFTALADDNDRKAFLINMYNAYIISELKNFNGDFDNLVDRTNFFNFSNLCLAGQKLSANNIEHDLLRNGRIWWSFGWLKKFSKNKFEQELSTTLDARIHFALNCGAASCPPVKIYTAEDLNEELERSTIAYLVNHIDIDSSASRLEVIELLNWFIKDFGGQKGLIGFLKERNIIPPQSDPKIKFTGYDWSLKPAVWENQ